jgi:hypothetical protein
MLLRKRAFIAAGVGAITLVAVVPTVSADAPSGAIFTTVADGSEVNLNHFPSKEAVYLDGGPGPGAPQTAAGLDDGTYVFQVTDPSGKVLLSTDPARCRQFTVSGGVITAVVMTGCQHATGDDVDHPPAKTVQLIPYANTPNNGGEYKVWATRVEDFLAGCQALGFPDDSGLDEVDCGFKDDETPPKGLNAHGFTTDSSKTDNFKVKQDDRIREIDSIFYEDENGNGTYDWYKETQLSGKKMIWTDTLGVQNTKWSYFLPPFNLTAAHAEVVEKGVHYVTIPDLSALGCVVGEIYVNDVNHYQPNPGPQTIKVDLSNISKADKNVTVQVWVACNSNS